MATYASKARDSDGGSTNDRASGTAPMQFADGRSTVSAERELQHIADRGPGQLQLQGIDAMANRCPRLLQLQSMAALAYGRRSLAAKANDTGLPEPVKQGIERLSGVSLDDVKVHYNSSKPAQLRAHAYAQGRAIHIAPGQEKHVAHEAWHIVQQKQGRVRPTVQRKGQTPVNDDPALESEADRMGAQALALMPSAHENPETAPTLNGAEEVAQAVFTSKGEKRHKIRQWVSVTKTALREQGEDLLLALFIRLDKQPEPVPWDIRESYAITRFKLRERLDREDNGDITTIADEELPTRKLSGAVSATGYKRLAAWDLNVDRGPLDPRDYTQIAHVSTSDGWMDKRIDTTYGSDTGELGSGFYTVSGQDGDVAAKKMRDEFGKTGNVPREVLKFRIANTELGALVNNDVALARFLVFILQSPSGYPPGSDHLALIQRINQIGKALIFPDMATPVDVNADGKQHSYNSYREINGVVGNHSLIIGPQARASLAGVRQICARGYLGDKIMNEAERSKSKLGKLNS